MMLNVFIYNVFVYLDEPSDNYKAVENNHNWKSKSRKTVFDTRKSILSF